MRTAAACLLAACALVFAGQVQTDAASQLPPLAVIQLDDRERTENLEAGRAFTVRFAEGLPVQDVLLSLVRDTSFSIVPDPGIDGTFAGELKNVTLRQALALILHPLGLDYTVEGTFIRVFERRLETRLFDVSHALARPALRRPQGVATSVGHEGPRQGAAASDDPGEDALAGLEAGVRTLVSDEARLHVDRRAGVLQVTDLPDRLDRVSLYLDAIRMRMQRQVHMVARVIEIELDERAPNGIDWPHVLGRAAPAAVLSGDRRPAVAGGLLLGARLADVDALVAALAMQGRMRVLASPRIVTLHNEPAIMRVGVEDVYFVTSSEVDAASGQVVRTSGVPRAVTEGLVVTVTPQVGSDNVVTLNVSPTVTERTGQATSRHGEAVPILSVRETDMVVRVHPGETVLVAGLLQDTERVARSKVPLLGDIPGLGGAFRREIRSTRRTELVLLLTPAVVPAYERAAPATAGDVETLTPMVRGFSLVSEDGLEGPYHDDTAHRGPGRSPD